MELLTWVRDGARNCADWFPMNNKPMKKALCGRLQ
jgi:hypothetical protein